MARNSDETIKNRIAEGYYSSIGQKGFEATVLNHFDGDRAAAAAWLRSQGQLIDRRSSWSSYPQEVFLYIKRKR